MNGGREQPFGRRRHRLTDKPSSSNINTASASSFFLSTQKIYSRAFGGHHHDENDHDQRPRFDSDTPRTNPTTSGSSRSLSSFSSSHHRRSGWAMTKQDSRSSPSFHRTSSSSLMSSSSSSFRTRKQQSSTNKYRRFLDVRQRYTLHLAIRTATAVAKASLPKTIKTNEHSRLYKQQCVLQEAMELAEMECLACLEEMEDPIRMAIIYDICDRAKKGFVTIVSLGYFMEKLHDLKEEDPETRRKAERVLEKFDSDRDRCLSKKEFTAFIANLAIDMGLSYQDLCHLVVCKLVFTTDGTRLLDDAVSESLGFYISPSNTDEMLNRARRQAKTRMLFDMLDTHRKGRVLVDSTLNLWMRFGMLSRELRREIEGLLQDSDITYKTCKCLSYKEFEGLVLTLANLCPKHITYDMIIHGLTVNAAAETLATNQKEFRKYQKDENVEALFVDSPAPAKLNTRMNVFPALKAHETISPRTTRRMRVDLVFSIDERDEYDGDTHNKGSKDSFTSNKEDEEDSTTSHQSDRSPASVFSMEKKHSLMVNSKRGSRHES